jgi:hypothetical protein
MRTSLAPRSGLAGLGSRLLLVLALCACGGGGDKGAKAAADTDTAAVRTTTAPAAADTCTTPPPAFSVAVLNGQPWKDLTDSLTAHGVTFPDIPGNDSIQSVKLCRNCTPVKMAIRASNFTPCLGTADLTGSGRRIVGEYVLQEAVHGQPGWHDIPAGNSIYVFAHANGAPATLVYEHDKKTNMGPPGAWQFWYCQHDTATTTDKRPQARWRPRGVPDDTLPRPDRPKDDDDVGDGDDEGGGTYGWMACASGCCQFYTPPPNDLMAQTTPTQASQTAPDTVGGGRRVGAPYWCRAGH